MKKDFLDAKGKDRIKFLLLMIVFAIFCVFVYFEKSINPQDTTVFAFSYKYGFISRGFLGTAWQFLDKILPMNLMDFSSIYKFTIIVTILFFITMLWFYNVCLKTCDEKQNKNMKYLCCFLSVFTFPMFLTDENFGRLDVYLMILIVVCCILIVKEKHEWLVVPICTLCVIMHHGFVFMQLNIVLVLFFYKILMNDKKRMKYILLFAFTFIFASIFFVYFEFFSHPEGEHIYEEIVTLAKSLSMTGNKYSESLVNHEILGLDVFEAEWKYHVINYIESPMFLVLFSPYIIIGIDFLRRLFIGKTVKEKWVYFAVAVCSLTVVPQMILKVDYGRYMFGFFFYYIVIVMCLIALKDQNVIYQLEDSIDRVKNRVPVGKFLIVYPMIFMPFLDVHICRMLRSVYELIFL